MGLPEKSYSIGNYYLEVIPQKACPTILIKCLTLILSNLTGASW
jgi:hypothetical protein